MWPLALQLAFYAAAAAMVKAGITRLAAEAGTRTLPADEEKYNSLLRRATRLQWVGLAAVFFSANIAPWLHHRLEGAAMAVDFLSFCAAGFFILTAKHPLTAHMRGLDASQSRFSWVVGRWLLTQYLPLILFFVVFFKGFVWTVSGLSFLPSPALESMAAFYAFVAVVTLFVLAAAGAIHGIAESLAWRILFRGPALQNTEIIEAIRKHFKTAGCREPIGRVVNTSDVGVYNMVIVSHPVLDWFLRPVLLMDAAASEQPTELIEPLIAHSAARIATREGLKDSLFVPLFFIAFSVPFAVIASRYSALMGGSHDLGLLCANVFLSLWLFSMVQGLWKHERSIDADAYAVARFGIPAPALARALEVFGVRNDYMSKRPSVFSHMDKALSGAIRERIERLRAGTPPGRWPAIIRALWKGRWRRLFAAAFYLSFAAAAASLALKYFHR